MRKATAILDEPTDFSLVQGGPLFQVLLRTKLLRPPTDLLARRIVVVAACAWLPLLSAVAGQAVGGPGVPFLFDVGVHARLLLCVPLLIGAEVVVHRRLKVIVRQFLDRGIIAPDDQPRFEGLIASAMRLRNSVLAEVLLLALAVAAGDWLGQRYGAMEMAPWYAARIDDQTRLTAAGYWHTFVSLSILRFLLVRWYFRLSIWYRFLWQVSRQVPLRLNALHPDRAGGLAFLSSSVFAFAPILLAHTIAVAGVLGGSIWHQGATLLQFKLEIAVWIVYLLLLVLTPLFFFGAHLADARRSGLREYGLMASRYVADFRRKWIDGHAAKDEALIGSADIQSLADLSNSFDVVRDTRSVPFDRATVIRLGILIVLPLLPLVLTMVPLEELVARLLKIVL